jgi:hypothetical protein
VILLLCCGCAYDESLEHPPAYLSTPMGAVTE